MEATMKQIRLIHLAFMAGATMHLLVFLFLFIEVETLHINWNSTLLFALLFLWSVPFVGKFVYDKIKAKVKEEDSDEHKMQQYQSAKIIVLATAEGLALFSTTLLMLEPNLLFLISSLCALGLLVLRRPTTYEVLRDFKFGNELN